MPNDPAGSSVDPNTAPDPGDVTDGGTGVVDDVADSGFRPVTSQEQFDRMVKERVARERAKFADYQELKTKASEFDRLQQEQMTELEREREARQQAEQRATQIEQEARETRLRAAILAEAAKADRRVVDPDAVIALLDRDTLEIDDNGTPTNIAEAMDSLLERRPYLVASGGTRGSADQGARPAGGPRQVTEAELKTMNHEQIEAARKAGQLDSLLGVR